MIKITPLLGLLFLFQISCNSPVVAVERTPVLHANQQVFWQAMQDICGNSYAGKVIAAPENDTVFKNKTLIMQVRSCNDSIVRIPFLVGTDLSRTWVFTKRAGDLELKHDHRHEDGSSDKLTMYGGHTSNFGTATVQYFPADTATTTMLPEAGGNVWWVEIIPGKSFTYNLRRMGTERLFSIEFDLSATISAPPAPWGWKD